MSFTITSRIMLSVAFPNKFCTLFHVLCSFLDEHFFDSGTNHQSYHYFLWGNSLWHMSDLDYKHISRMNYAYKPTYHWISNIYRAIFYKWLHTLQNVFNVFVLPIFILKHTYHVQLIYHLLHLYYFHWKKQHFLQMLGL